MDFYRTPWISTGFQAFPPDFHRFPLDSMDFDKILWISKDFHGIPLFSTGLHRFPLVFMDFHWIPLISFGLLEFPLDSIDFHWIPWISTGFQGFPSHFYGFRRYQGFPFDFHWISIGFQRFPSDSMDFRRIHAFSLNSMDFHQIPWIFTGFPWNSMTIIALIEECWSSELGRQLRGDRQASVYH